MNRVFVRTDNIISALGFSTNENLEAFHTNQCGLNIADDPLLTGEPVPLAMIDNSRLSHAALDANITQLSKFEQLITLSVLEALRESKIDIQSDKVLIIISTTKGNIDLLTENSIPDEVWLWNSAHVIKEFFQAKNTPIVVSNACTSGVMAINIGARYIQQGKFEHVVITGGDILSRFVISGFQSFKSLSPAPCKPFDKNRDGLSLGEGAGTIILSNHSFNTGEAEIEYVNGASANDANHISGPSRTGEGLYLSIKKTLKGFVMPIDYISAHGTATPYNDDMESKALKRNNLQTVPVNSIKGYIGHTLGAAGIIETIVGIRCMQQNIIYKTLGFTEPGVAEPIYVVAENVKKPIKTFLKIASGFGGVNASALFRKNE